MELMGRDELVGPWKGAERNGGNGDPSDMHSHPHHIDVLEDFEPNLAGWRWIQGHLVLGELAIGEMVSRTDGKERPGSRLRR